MIYKVFGAHTLFVAFSAATLLTGHANAQTRAPAASNTPAAVPPAPFKSAFEGYQPYSDDKMTGWKAANDEVARIGGWREYAKQAQQADNPSPTNAGDVKPKATP